MPIFEIDLVRQLRSKAAALLAQCDARIGQLEGEPVAPMPVTSVTPICITSREMSDLFNVALEIGEWAEWRQEIVDESWCEEFKLDEDDPTRVRIGDQTTTWAELRKAHEEDLDLDRLLNLNVRKMARLVGLKVS